MKEKLSDRLISLLDAMEDGIYIVREDKTVEFMNQAMIRSFGGGIGERCYKVLASLDEPCPWCRNEDVFHGKTTHWELEMPDTDKTYDIVELPFRSPDGTLMKLSIFRDITKRKERERTLQAREEDYRRLFESVRCGVYISSKEGKFLDSNQALLEMLGYESKEEFLSLDLARDVYFRAEDRGKFQRMIARDGHVQDYEVTFKGKDGRPVPVLLTSHVRKDAGGQVVGYEGIVMDESRKKQMEADYKRLFEHVGVGVYISSKEGRFLDSNQALLDMLGYESREEFLTIDIARDLYLHPEERKKFQDLIERDGRVVGYEVEFKRKDGTPIPVLHTGHVRTDPEGNVLGYEGINVDLSHRKKMERELKEANTFMLRIIQSSPNAIMAADMKGNIVIWNHGAEETLGYPMKEVIGKMNIVEIYPEGMAKKVMQMLRSEDYGGVGRLRPHPMVYVRKDGRIVEGTLSAAILYDADGKEVASVGIFVDLEERLEMERKLHQTQEQLLQSEKLAAMGRLTSQIAHELNNPLYGIMNTLELLKTEVPVESKRRKILEMALSETVRLTDMLRKMLSFSKPDEEERQPSDINVILDEIILLHEKQLREHSIKIATSYSEDIGKIHASKNQLRQVFLNMIANARDAMPDGGTLSVTTKSVGQDVHIEISDTGIGIREENLDKIFDAFFTTKDNIKGVGLGLSVCYGFIQDHGGDIKVQSKRGEGTTFTIILPQMESDTQEGERGATQ